MNERIFIRSFLFFALVSTILHAAAGQIWGAGPIILIPLPTTICSEETSGVWSPPHWPSSRRAAGLTAVLANQLWSFGGGGSATTNATNLQPFVSYTTKTHTTFGLNSEFTYDWRGGRWSIPFNLMASQLVKIGELPMQFQVGGRGYAGGPDGGPNRGLRFTVTLLLPKS